MTPGLIRRVMADHKLDQGDLARLMGVTRKTANAWACGRSSVPHSARMLIHALDQGLITVAWLEGR